MREPPNTYTTSDLAERVGVPRTTINDWLTRYAAYIDYKAQGKRKLYLDSTVAVLKEISEFRDRGLSSFEIEQELAKRHPVHGEITPPPESTPKPSEEGARNNDSQENGSGGLLRREDADREFAIAAKHQAEEIAKMLSDHLRGIEEKMKAIEENTRSADRKANRWYLLAMVLVALLVLVVFVAYGRMTRLLDENRRIESQHQSTSEQLHGVRTDLDSTRDKAKELEEEKERLAKQTRDLRENLERQRIEFTESLNARATEAENARQTEILRLRDEFAASRLETLKRLDEAVANERTKDELLRKLQEQAERQTEAIRGLSGTIHELSKPPPKEKDASAPPDSDTPPEPNAETVKPEMAAPVPALPR
jgi:DNA-binding transcriptional MerR regulator